MNVMREVVMDSLHVTILEYYKSSSQPDSQVIAANFIGLSTRTNRVMKKRRKMKIENCLADTVTG